MSAASYVQVPFAVCGLQTPYPACSDVIFYIISPVPSYVCGGNLGRVSEGKVFSIIAVRKNKILFVSLEGGGFSSFEMARLS